MPLHRALAVARTAVGIESKDLAKAAGLAPATLTTLERGQRLLHPELFERLFLVLGQIASQPRPNSQDSER